MSRFVGKAAIVTGSSNGIGRAVALLFVQEGAKVTITGRNVERLEETKQELFKVGVTDDSVNVVLGDVTSEEVRKEIVDSTIQKFGKIDILVNNAGGGFSDPTGKIGVDMGIDFYDYVFNLNLRSIVDLTQKARPHLKATKGEIVNVSSIAGGTHACEKYMYYGMSKSALNHYTKSAAVDLISEGIRVNSVSPGFVITGFMEAGGATKDASKKMYDFVKSQKASIPAGFVAEASDIASLIAFLADRKASAYIIGQSIVADGGSSLIMGMSANDFGSLLSS